MSSYFHLPTSALASLLIASLALLVAYLYTRSSLAVRHRNTSVTMKYWVVVKNSNNPREALSLKNDGIDTKTTESTLPTPKGTHIVIRVSHAGLNPADLHFMINLPTWLPFRRHATPAIDFAGEIVAMGPNAANSRGHTKTPLAIGSRVAGCMAASYVATGHGALAEYVTVPAEMVARQPEKRDGVVSVGLLGCAGQTAHQCATDNLARDAFAVAVKEGRQPRVLINGASGGVGSLLIQISKHESRGAHVTAVCSSRNTDFVRGLGADETIDYRKHKSLAAHLAATFSENPFDIIYDCIGDQPLYLQSPAYLTPKGAVLCIVGGTSQGVVPVVRNNLIPTFLGGTPRTYKLLAMMPSGLRARAVAEMVDDGTITDMPIDSVWPMTDVVEAYDKLKTKHARGKIVIRVDPTLKE